MAFRSAGAWSFTANSVVNPTTLTPGAPAGVVKGDCLVLICNSRSNTATVATPTGWTLLTGFPVRSGTASGGTYYVFVRIADGSGTDTPSPVWTGLTTGTSGDASGAGILAYSLTQAVLDGVVQSSDLSAQTTTTTIPASTTTNAGSVVIGVAMKLNESSGQTSTVATFTERADNQTTTGTGHTIEVSDITVASPGSSGTAAVTWSVTTSARALAISFSLQAMRPPPQPALSPVESSILGAPWQPAWDTQQRPKTATLVPPGTGGAWVRTGGGSALGPDDGTSSTSQSTASSVAVAINDVIVVFSTYDDNGGAVSSDVITDNLGNVYTVVPGSTGVENNQHVQYWVSFVTVAGTPTITQKFNPTPGTTQASFCGFDVDTYRWTGGGGAPTLDGTGATNTQVSPTTATDATVSGSFTVSNPNSLLLSGTVDENSGGNPGSPGTGFTIGISGGSGGSIFLKTEYKALSAAGSVQGTWTAAANDDHITSAIAIAPPASSGGLGSQPTPIRQRAAEAVQAVLAWLNPWSAQSARSLPQAGAAPPATWVYRGGISANSDKGVTAVTQLQATLGFALNLGDVVKVGMTYDNSAGHPVSGTTFSDNLGNSYVLDVATHDAGDGQDDAIWTCYSVTHAGTPTFTLEWTPTPGTTQNFGCVFNADVFTPPPATTTGASSIPSADGSSGATDAAPGTGADAAASGSISTAIDGDLIYTSIFDGTTGNQNWNLGTGLSLCQNSNTSTGFGFSTAWRVQSTHGAVQGTWTPTVGGDAYIVQATATAPPQLPASTPPGNGCLASTLAVIAATWAIGAIAVSAAAKIAPLLAGGGQAPAPTSQSPPSIAAQTNLAWQPTWTAQRGAQIAPITLSYGAAPTPQGFLSPVELSIIGAPWVPMWPAQEPPDICPLTLTSGVPPTPATSQLATTILSQWAPPPWTAQSEADNAAWNVPIIAQVPPASVASLLAQLVAASTVSWTPQGAAPVAALASIVYGAQPLQAPSILPILAAWLSAPWAAQSENDTAAWNVPVQVPFVARPLFIPAVEWSAQGPPKLVPVSGGNQPQLGAATPTVLLQYAHSWQVTWSAQRGATVAPLTLSYGQQPQSPNAPIEFVVRMARLSILDWPAQRGAVIAPLTLAYGAAPESAAPQPGLLAQLANAWAVTWNAQSAAPNAAWNVLHSTVLQTPVRVVVLPPTWDAQVPPKIAPIASLVYGAQPPSLNARLELIARAARAFVAEWPAQRAPLFVPPSASPAQPWRRYQPVADAATWPAQRATGIAPLLVVGSVPATSPPLAIWRAWQSVEWLPPGRAAIAPLISIYVPPGVSPQMLAQLVRAWTADWPSITRPSLARPFFIGRRPGRVPVSSAFCAPLAGGNPVASTGGRPLRGGRPVASVGGRPLRGGRPISALGGAALAGGNPIAAGCVPIRTMPLVVVSDAIISPSIEFVDGFDLGVMQSLGGSSNADRAAFQAGRWKSVFGQFVWHETGGRDNGGWLEVVGADSNPEDLDHPIGAALGIGQYNPLLPAADQGLSDDPSQNPVNYPWMGYFVGLNQRGLTPDGTTGLLGAGLLNTFDPNSLHGYPRFVIRPDYGIDLIGTDFAPTGPADSFVATDYLLYSSPAGIVPADAWYGLEIQVGLNPFGMDKGGFALLTMYRESDGPLGFEAVRQVGVRTGSITNHLSGPQTSATEFTLIPVYLQVGTGIDDFVYYEPTGATKRWLRDLNIEGCPPTADVGTPQSIVVVTNEQAEGTPPKTYGGTFRFGSDDRSQNVSVANSESRPALDPESDKAFSIGTVSGNTGLWLDGPNAPPPDPIVSNKVLDTAKDLFSIAPQRTRGTVEVVGMAIRGGSVIRAIAPDLVVLFGDEFGAGGPFLNVHGPDRDDVDPPGLDDPTTNWRALVRPIIRSGSTEYSTYPFIGQDSHGNQPGWRSINNYWPPLRHVVQVDPATGIGWTLAAALAHRIGYVGDPTVDIPGSTVEPPLHHVKADIIGLASEIVYHPVAISEAAPPLRAPICDVGFSHWGGGALVDANGVLAGIFHNCVDFNDGPSHIIDHVTVVVNFGDGTPPQTFAGPGLSNTLMHTFARAGNLTIVVTATNAHGLTCTVSTPVTVANRAPTAAFSFSVDDSDDTGFTIDFTNGSSDPDGDAMTFAWDFDFAAHPGVHTSTATNPSFNFTSLGAGAHTVQLTVDDGHGHSVTTSHVVTVPIGAGVTWELDEQFPDADDAAFSARVNADTDYDTDYTDTRLIGCTLDNAVQFRGHQSMKVDVQAGAGILDLYHHTPDLRDYWTAIALRFPATFYQGNLSNFDITTAVDLSQPAQMNAWSNDGAGGGGFGQFIQTMGVNIHGPGGTPVVYSPFEASGNDFDEFVYDNDEASSGRTVANTIPFATLASDSWIIFVTRTTTTTTSIRNRSWYSTDDGATWTLLTDQTVDMAQLNGDTVLPSGWIEFEVTHTAALHAGDVIHVGMLQIADATLPGNSDPYGTGP